MGISVFEARGTKWEHVLDLEIACERAAAELCRIDVRATMNLGEWEGINLDGLNVEGLLKRYGRQGLSAEERTRYHVGLGEDPGIIRNRHLDIEIGVPGGEHELQELEEGAFFDETAKMASTWLRILMEINDGLRVKMRNAT
jgi:hypothetical protein